MARPLPSAISAQGLERIVDSDESLTSDMDLSKPSSDIDAAATGSSQASSDIACHIQPHPVESARVVKKGKLELARNRDKSSESAFQDERDRSYWENKDQSVQKSNSVEVRGFECRKNSVRQSKKILVKVPTITNLNLNADSDRFSPSRSREGYLLREERCRFRKHLSHSLSFQSNHSSRLKEARPGNEGGLLSSSSFNTGKLKMRRSNRFENFSKLQSRLGYPWHEDSVSSSANLDSMELDESLDDNIVPPPLSNLHIFAISTKPEDIQLAPMEESIPGDIDKLPSLPIIDHSEKRLNTEKKLSILEPPPPGLVSREESNENWNRFLMQLNSILESRAGAFV